MEAPTLCPWGHACQSECSMSRIHNRSERLCQPCRVKVTPLLLNPAVAGRGSRAQGIWTMMFVPSRSARTDARPPCPHSAKRAPRQSAKSRLFNPHEANLEAKVFGPLGAQFGGSFFALCSLVPVLHR